MFLIALFAQFTHLSDDGHLLWLIRPPLPPPTQEGNVDLTEIVEGSAHRGGVGVVGIDDEVVLLGDGHLRAVVRGNVFFQSCTDLLAVHAEVDAYGDGGQEVVDVVGADELRLHLMPLGAATFLLKHHQRFAPTELQEGITFDDLARDTAVPVVGIGGVGRHPDLFVVADLTHQVLVVGIDEDETVLAATEEVVELAFGPDDTLEGSEAQQMGAAYVGDQTAGGLCRLCECLDVARMAGTHLDDGDLVLLRQAEEGLGHAYVVVEVALGIEHIVFLREHSSDEFLGGRFSVGSCDADDGDVELTTMFAGQILVSLQTILNDNDS